MTLPMDHLDSNVTDGRQIISSPRLSSSKSAVVVTCSDRMNVVGPCTEGSPLMRMQVTWCTNAEGSTGGKVLLRSSSSSDRGCGNAVLDTESSRSSEAMRKNTVAAFPHHSDSISAPSTPTAEHRVMNVSCHVDAPPPSIVQISLDLCTSSPSPPPPYSPPSPSATSSSPSSPPPVPLRHKLNPPSSAKRKAPPLPPSHPPEDNPTTTSSPKVSHYPFTLVNPRPLSATPSMSPPPPIPPRSRPALGHRRSEPVAMYPIPSPFPALVQPPVIPPTGDATVQCHQRQLEMSGFFYGRLSWKAAEQMLQGTREGTFLLRESENPYFIFSLSVQTRRGPTSVRIVYECGGKYRLDADRPSPSLPAFTAPLELIDHYVQRTQSNARLSKDSTTSQGAPQRQKALVWKDPFGETFSPILLVAPLRKNPPSLVHLCRLVINRHRSLILKPSTSAPEPVSNPGPPLPPRVKAQLIEYPFQN